MASPSCGSGDTGALTVWISRIPHARDIRGMSLDRRGGPQPSWQVATCDLAGGYGGKACSEGRHGASSVRSADNNYRTTVASAPAGDSAVRHRLVVNLIIR